MPNLEDIASTMNTVGDITDVAGKILSGPSKLVGGFIGIAQGRRARRTLAQADRLLPGPEDPETRNLLNIIQRKGKMIERGVDPVTAYGKKLIKSNLATTQANVLRGSRRDPRFLLTGLRRSQIDASTAVGSLAANIYPASQYYTNLGVQLQQKISERKFGLKMSQRLQKLREGYELLNTSRQNIAGALGTILPT